MIKSIFTFVLAVELLCAASARAQSVPTPQYNDEQTWAMQLSKAIPPGELSGAAFSAESTGTPDPLTALALQHNIAEPDWLKARIAAQRAGTALAAMGDSITAAMASCSFPYYYCPDNSWSTGSLPTSVRTELAAQSGKEVGSFLVAVPGVTMTFIPYEAYAVFLASFFGLNVQRMTLFIGHNDPGVCGAVTATQTQDFGDSYSSALRILAHVAAQRSARLYVASITEVPVLARYADVVPNGSQKTCRVLWKENNRCGPVTQHVDDPAALAKISAQIATYDGLLAGLAQGKSWVSYQDIFNANSRRGLSDPATELSPFDCFHPSVVGQGTLGRLAWQGFDGAPGIADFFRFPSPALSPSLAAELDGWTTADF